MKPMSYINSLCFRAWCNSEPRSVAEAFWLFLYRLTS